MKETSDFLGGLLCDLSSKVEKVICKQHWWWKWEEKRMSNIVNAFGFQWRTWAFLSIICYLYVWFCMLICYFLEYNLSLLIWICGIYINEVGQEPINNVKFHCSHLNPKLAYYIMNVNLWW
jgi:hypothetical protein